ncbi:alpha/beta hydrolase family esterase [Nocardia jiangsuensis]|uniref:Alpha/beta hydrolase family esterase n=1 Tax=Nocardia jiangsuensis TaxID=1691563 RepID=A0ABV8DQR2_9NOCA
MFQRVIPGRVLGAVAATAALLAAPAAVPAAAGADPGAVPSAGCAIPAAAAGHTTQTYAGAGRTGFYLRDVPAAPGPYPLVVDLHGYLEPAEIQTRSSGVGEYGLQRGYATVTPQIDEPGPPRWNFQPGGADIDWLTGVLDDAEAALCVDTRRVYVTGLSMGAFTSSALACRLSGRIAAVAPVAGLQDFEWCDTTRPVPVIAFHGTDDPIVAYGGGAGPNARLLPRTDGTGSANQQNLDRGPNGPAPRSIPDNAAAWAARNGCAAGPAVEQVAPDVVRYRYSCPADGSVEFWSITGGGHVWPGSKVPFPEPFVGKDTPSIAATPIIWDFFQAHPLPA